MSWYHTVSPGRLSDDRLRGASLLARHLWAHFLVSELATKLPGLVRGGLATIAEHIEASPADTLAAMEEMATRGVIEFDLAARLVRLVGMLDDFEIPAKSNPTISGWMRVAREQPRCELVARHTEEYSELCPNRATDWTAIAARCRRIAPPQPLSATTRPPGSPPVALPVSDPDLDPDPDLDLDPPLPPRGGDTVDRGDNRVIIADDERTHPEVSEALELLAAAREQAGLAALPPSAREVRRQVRKLAERDAVPLLPSLVRRHAAQVLRAMAEGRDERASLNLRGVVRRLDALSVDGDERARSPPASQALSAGATNDF